MMLRSALRFVAICTFCVVQPAQAAEDRDYPSDELVHSDLPLWTFADKDFYPQHFSNKDSWGCSSRVAFGRWKYEPNSSDFAESVLTDPEWWHLANYGVFHCALSQWRSDIDSLDKTDTVRSAWIVKIGTTRIDGQIMELWDLQAGGRPGSDHVLLMRKPESGLITRFQVLQRACPKALRRSGPQLDIWKVGYCAVNAREDLVALAERMAQLPALATLTWDSPEPD